MRAGAAETPHDSERRRIELLSILLAGHSSMAEDSSVSARHTIFLPLAAKRFVSFLRRRTRC